MQRIDKVTNAMELRGFGTSKKRTWYNATTIKVTDIIVLIMAIIGFAALIYYKAVINSGFRIDFI